MRASAAHRINIGFDVYFNRQNEWILVETRLDVTKMVFSSKNSFKAWPMLWVNSSSNIEINCVVLMRETTMRTSCVQFTGKKSVNVF